MSDERVWAQMLARAGLLPSGAHGFVRHPTPRTIANPSGFPGGSPGGGQNDHRYWSENQPPRPDWYTADPSQQPGGAPQPQPSLQIHPPWEFPPSGSQIFQPATDTTSAGVAQLAAGVGATITIPGLSYLTPNAMISVVRTVSIFVNGPTTAFNVDFWLRNNGQPLTQTPFRTQAFIAGALVRTFSVTLRDIPPGTIDMLIVNQGAGGPWTVGGGFSGWSYTQAQAAALTGGLPN